MELQCLPDKYLKICTAAHESLQMLMQISLSNTLLAQKVYDKIIEKYNSCLNETEFIIFKSELFFPSNKDFINKYNNGHYKINFRNQDIFENKIKQLSIEQKLFDVSINEIPRISDDINFKLNIFNLETQTRESIYENMYDLFLETMLTYENNKVITKRKNSMFYNFYILQEKVDEYHKYIYHTSKANSKVANMIFDSYICCPFENKYISSSNIDRIIQLVDEIIIALDLKKEKQKSKR